MALSSDDLDDMDIAAYSADVEQQADDFKTLGQLNIEKDEAAKKKKEQEAKEKEE